MRDRLRKESAWKTRLGQDFDVRSYVFDSHLRAVDGFDAPGVRRHRLDAGDVAVGPVATVPRLAAGRRPPVQRRQPDRRGRRRLVAVAADLSRRAPCAGSRGTSASATSRPARPTSSRPPSSSGPTSPPSASRARRSSPPSPTRTGKELERQEAKATGDGKPLELPVPVPPRAEGRELLPRPRVSPPRTRRRTQAAADDAAAIERADARQQQPARRRRSGERPLPGALRERTAQLGVQVPPPGRRRGRAGPARRPAADRPSPAEVRLPRRPDPGELAPLQGVRQPRRRHGRAADQPVLVRLGTLDEVELRDGFPKAADELYRYHAVILDDLEAAFFTQDQLALLAELREPPRRRTPDARRPRLVRRRQVRPHPGRRAPAGLSEPAGSRTRSADQGDPIIAWCSPAKAGSSRGSGRGRPRRKSSSGWRRWRPSTPSAGSTTSSRGPWSSREVRDPAGKTAPALVAQQFGKGHVAALLIGDLWRWGIRREDPAGERPRSLVAANRPLARRRRPGPGGSRRAAQGRARTDFARRRAHGRGSATPSIGRSTTPRSPSRSPCPAEKPDARRRARRPRGRHLRGHVRPQAARAPIGSSRPRPPRTAAPSASAKPAGRPSPRPTSSPGSSPTGNT